MSRNAIFAAGLLVGVVAAPGGFYRLSLPNEEPPAAVNKSNPTREFIGRLDQLLTGDTDSRTPIPRSLWEHVGAHGEQALPVIRRVVEQMKHGNALARQKANVVAQLLDSISRHNRSVGSMQPSRLERDAETIGWEMAMLGGDPAIAALSYLDGAWSVAEHYEDLLTLGHDGNREVRVWAGRVFLGGREAPRTGQFGRALPMLLETLDALLDQELTGTADLVLTPYFGVGYQSRTREARGRLAELVAGMSVSGKLPLIKRFLGKDPVAGFRAVALGGLLNEYAGKPYIEHEDAIPVLRAALKDPSAAVMVSALTGIRARKLQVLAGEVIPLASHHRQKVRMEAAATLKTLKKPLPSRRGRTARWPAGSREAFLEFASRGLANPRGGMRGRGAIVKRSSWGTSERLTDLPGWGIRQADGSISFVDDDQEHGLITGGPGGFRVTDFDKELRARIAVLKRQPSRGTSPASRGSALLWIEGTAAHDLLRLIWALAVGKEKEALELFLLLAQEFDSDQDMIHFAASELGWVLYLHALDAFAQADDQATLEYANRLLQLAPYQKPQQALSHYVTTARVLSREIAMRRSERIPAAPPKDGDHLAYWIARLPDTRGRQWGQPGGVTVFTGLEPRVAERLVEIGLPALPELYAHFWDERVIRAVGFWRDFHRGRHLVTVGEAARHVFFHITEEHHLVIPERFRNADDVPKGDRQSQVAAFRSWFKENAEKKRKRSGSLPWTGSGREGVEDVALAGGEPSHPSLYLRAGEDAALYQKPLRVASQFSEYPAARQPGDSPLGEWPRSAGPGTPPRTKPLAAQGERQPKA